MTEQDLIKFKNLSMQDGRLNLQWFADYVAQAEREKCAEAAWKALIDKGADWSVRQMVSDAIKGKEQE